MRYDILYRWLFCQQGCVGFFIFSGMARTAWTAITLCPDSNTERKIITTDKESKYSMKESIYKTYDELPLFLNAGTVARVLGV